MSHSGIDHPGVSSFVMDELRRQQKEIAGKHPDGKLNEKDEGALALAVGIENDKVVISFAKPTAWIGFTGDQAAELANTLWKYAKRVGITKPLEISL